MAESYHSSMSSLCEVEQLRARLEEKENTLQTAAQYGKDLLDQNRELTQNLDDTNRNYTKQIETLKEENYSLGQRLHQRERMELEYQDEIDSLKKHLTSQRDELKVLRSFADHSKQLSDLRSQLREAEGASDKLECDNRQLQALNSSYEQQNQELKDKLQSIRESMSESASDDLSSHVAELNSVTQARDELMQTCRTQQSEMASLSQQVEVHLHQISGLHDDLTSANSQISDLSNSYMAATQENQELRGEIDALRMNDRDHKAKGNSMFTELDDKRQEAEKKLLLLNVKYEGLLNQHDLNKKQMSKLKIQMSNILRMASGQVSCDHVSDLENQLVEAHNEIKALTSKLSKMSTSEGVRADEAQTMEGSMFVGSDRHTLQFVEGLLKSKDEELKSLAKELDEKRLAASYSNQQLNDVQHRLRSMEGKVNALHSQNIQLCVKLDDLKSKYEENTGSDARLVHRHVEDIPDFNPEMAQALLTADSGPGSVVGERVEESSVDTHSQSAAYEVQSTASDTRSLSEIQNLEKKPEPPSKLSPSPTKSRLKNGSYYNKRSPSLYSSTDSLLGGKASVKSCDNELPKTDKKVIDVKVSGENPNNCPTQ